MPEKRVYRDNFTTVRSNKKDADQDWAIGFTAEADALMREHPGIRRQVIDLLIDVDETDALNKPVQRGELTATLVAVRSTYRKIYRLDAAFGSFFIKRVDLEQQRAESQRNGKTEKDATPEQGGFREITSTNAAKNILKRVPWVKFLDYQLGYQDQQASYFVARWHEGPMVGLAAYIAELNDQIDIPGPSTARAREQLAQINSRILTLKSHLYQFHDVRPENMGYEPETGDIILFDLNLEEGFSA